MRLEPELNVLITGALHEQAIAAFQNDKSLNVTYTPDCSREDLLKNLQEAHVLVSRSETTVDREAIEHAPQLKLIARAAVGVGNIDVDLATEKGILVINCPGKNTNSAAELTVGLLLGVFRKIATAYQTVSQGGWDRHKFTGLELKDKKIGLVGLGNVGHRVAKFAKGFDMEVFAYDPYISPDRFSMHKAHKIDQLETLMETVDIVSVHTPLNSETKGMIDKTMLQKMKKGGIVINAARGGIIEESDLLEALKSEHIAGAGIDTFCNEPTPMQELVAHPKVLCTPHIGATTTEAQILIGTTVYEQVKKFKQGSVVDYPVNLPQIGVIDDPGIKSYSLLAEKLGSMIGQIISFNPGEFLVKYRGNIAESDHSLIKLSLIKGYTDQVVDGYVSFVNAEQHFENMGIRFSEEADPEFQSYRSAVKITVKGQDQKTLTIGGVVFDNNYPRISLLNDFYFEVEPVGEILIIENNDKPGVVGDVGQYLAKSEINIDSFNLSRNKKGGNAMALIRVDGGIEKTHIEEILKIPNIMSARKVSL